MKNKIKLYLDLITNFNEKCRNNLNNYYKETTFNLTKSRASIQASDILKIKDIQVEPTSPNNQTSQVSRASNTSTVSRINSTGQSMLSRLNSNNSKRSKRISGLISNINYNNNNDNKEKTNSTIGFSYKMITQILFKKRILIISKQNFIFIFAGITIITLFWILEIINNIEFKDTVKNSIESFMSISVYLNLIPSGFNSLREIMVRKDEKITKEKRDIFLQFSTVYDEDVKQIFYNNSLSKFSAIKDLWNSLNIPINSSNKKQLEYICSTNKICEGVISKENSYFTKGIILGNRLIIQKMAEIWDDYDNFEKNNPNYTKSELNKFLEDKDFNNLQESVDFVLNFADVGLYSTFYNDYFDVKRYLLNNSLILNSFCAIIQIILIIIFITLILVKFKRLVYLIILGSSLFNRSFYQNLN